jgi:hypothetical protein
MSIEAASADPLVTQPRAERPAYATGMLLDAQDFSAEQLYHRARLARALVFLSGGGALAGLRVTHAAAGAQPEEIRVAPGVAVDRLGRLVEVPRDACLRLVRWWDALPPAPTGVPLSAAQRARYPRATLERLVSPRLADASAVLPECALVADVYLRFAACKVGLTPSFAAGPFDALNAVTTSRLRDAYELLMLPRTGLDTAFAGLPLPAAGAAVNATPADDAERRARRDAAQDASLAAWDRATQKAPDGTLGPGAEHELGMDTSAVFLARVFIPVELPTSPADPLQRTSETPLVDNGGRRFLPTASVLAQALGL